MPVGADEMGGDDDTGSRKSSSIKHDEIVSEVKELMRDNSAAIGIRRAVQ